MRELVLIPLVALLALAGCKSGDVTVSGTVTYRERMALPPDAVVKVAIEDVSLGDAPVRLIASTEIKTAGRQVPIGFAITLMDPGSIDPKHQYGLRVRIEDGAGALMFINDTRYSVITNGVLKQDVVVKRVAAP